MKHIEILRLLGACGGPGEALPWAMNYPDAQSAWDASPRGDWMAWLVGRVAQNTLQGSHDRRRATLIACLCARTVTHLAGEHAPEIECLLSRIEARAWGDNTVDLSTVRDRLRLIRCTSATLSPSTLGAGLAGVHALVAARAVADASIGEATAVRVTVAADAAAYAAAYADVDPDADDDGACGAWRRGRDECRRDLADLIRSAIPNVSDLFDHMSMKPDPKVDRD